MPAKPSIEQGDGAVLVRVRLQPKASREAILREAAGRIHVSVTAPPIDGAANKALQAFLAKKVGVSKGCVKIIGGEKSRNKTLAIQGTTVRAVRDALG